MAKSIDIKIGTSFDRRGVDASNHELAKLANSVGRVNQQMRQGALVDARDFMGIGAAADKAVVHATLSAKEIEEKWRSVMDSGKKESKGFGDVFASIARGVGGNIGKIAGMLSSGAVWGAAAIAIVHAFSFVWKKLEEESKRTAELMAMRFDESVGAVKKAVSGMDESFSKSMSTIDGMIGKFERLTSSVQKLNKAEIELAKQQAIAGGMSREDAERAAGGLNAELEYETEKARLEKIIKLEGQREEAAKRSEQRGRVAVSKAGTIRAAAEAEYQKALEAYVQKNAATTMDVASPGGYGTMKVNLGEDAIQRSRTEAAIAFRSTEEAKRLQENIKKAADAQNGIKTVDNALKAQESAREKIEAAQRSLAELETRREASRLATENEIADIAVDASKKQEAARAREIEAERAARMKMESELHAQRISDIRSELDGEKRAREGARASVASAQTEFDRAFAMYRDKDLAARTIQEERDYAEDYKRLGRDANRYGGKWRIDELASLMAAGDTAGQKAALERWRKNGNFTPEVEAMVRASAADQARTTAEDELRKISHNTESLAAKLDELLQVK